MRLRVWLPVLLFVASCDDAPPAPALLPEPIPSVDPAVLRVAGSGAMTPLATRLARAWATLGGSPRVVVEPSIGSPGGARAAADGAVDLGMVARPLSDQERALGLEVLPVARDAVVLAAHPGVPIDGISTPQILALFSGQTGQYQDGSPALVLLRDRGDSAHSAFERQVSELRPVRERAYDEHRFEVVFHDDTMGAMLASSTGAVGVFSLGAVSTWHLPLKVLSVDGVTATVEHLEDGTWKASRELIFVLRPDRRPRADGFLAYVRSDEARALMRSSGYLPVTEASP